VGSGQSASEHHQVLTGKREARVGSGTSPAGQHGAGWTALGRLDSTGRASLPVVSEAMSIETRWEAVTVGSDSFDAYCALPASGRGPGLLVLQEIFGVNANMRALAVRFAEVGYVALVPDMFWRVERRFERSDDSGMADAFAVSQRFDPEAARGDLQAAHAHLLGLAGCTGRVGAVGFCLGGTLAFLTATSSRVDGRSPDAVVCYYGSGINDYLGEVDRLESPILLHYGTRDDYITADKVAEVEAALAGRPDVEIHLYDAGHAFSNEDSARFYDPAAAAEAWPRTLEFLSRHLGT